MCCQWYELQQIHVCCFTHIFWFWLCTWKSHVCERVGWHMMSVIPHLICFTLLPFFHHKKNKLHGCPSLQVFQEWSKTLLKSNSFWMQQTVLLHLEACEHNCVCDTVDTLSNMVLYLPFNLFRFPPHSLFSKMKGTKEDIRKMKDSLMANFKRELDNHNLVSQDFWIRRHWWTEWMVQDNLRKEIRKLAVFST